MAGESTKWPRFRQVLLGGRLCRSPVLASGLAKKPPVVVSNGFKRRFLPGGTRRSPACGGTETGPNHHSRRSWATPNIAV